MAETPVFRHNISAADGVHIRYRLDGILFNILRLQAVTKVTNDTIRRRRCPAQPHARRPAATARCNLFCIPLRRAGRQLGDQFRLTEQFTHLGSIITSTCDLTAKIQHRVNLASASFWRLSKRVFTNCDLSTRTKRDGHRTVVTSEPSMPGPD